MYSFDIWGYVDVKWFIYCKSHPAMNPELVYLVFSMFMLMYCQHGSKVPILKKKKKIGICNNFPLHRNRLSAGKGHPLTSYTKGKWEAVVLLSLSSINSFLHCGFASISCIHLSHPSDQRNSFLRCLTRLWVEDWYHGADKTAKG
jgi:hypothetical protein